jgi:hypothetical protein
MGAIWLVCLCFAVAAFWKAWSLMRARKAEEKRREKVRREALLRKLPRD